MASINTNGTGATTTITLANLTPAQDGEARSVNAVIEGAVTTESGTTTIKFASGDSAKTLTLSEGGNTITNFAFGTGDSTNNTIILEKGITTFNNTSAIDVGANNEIAFTLKDNVTLSFTNGLANSGNTDFNFNEANATLSGNITTNAGGSTTFNLGSSTSADRKSVV